MFSHVKKRAYVTNYLSEVFPPELNTLILTYVGFRDIPVTGISLPGKHDVYESYSIASYKGCIYVGNSRERDILRLDYKGKLLASWKTENYTRRLHITHDEIYTCDLHEIYVYNLEGKYLRSWRMEHEIGEIASQREEIYVIEHSDNDCIRVFTRVGEFLRMWRTPGLNGERFVPMGIAAYNNEVFVANRYDCIQVFSPEGKLLRQWGKTGKGKGEFDAPTRIKIIDAEIYVVDLWNGRIQVFSLAGEFLRFIHPERAAFKMTIALDTNYLYYHSSGNGALELYEREIL